MAKITVVGSFVMDNVAKMKKFPEAGESILGESIELFPGGKGANQCVAISRLGGDVEMIGMLGKDSNGDVFRKILEEEGIKADNVYTCEKPTAIAQVQINAEGQNRICAIPSANHEFGFKELEKVDEILKNTQLVVLQLEMRLDVTKELIRRVHGYGVKILLNPAPAVILEEDILSKIDYLTPNETELSILTGLPTETDEEVIAAAKKLLKTGVKNIIATLGGRGALIATKNNVQIVPGYKVKAIDTVAAGDSFNGALAVALMEGKTLEEAVKFANAMGALTVQKKGAIPSLHKRTEVEDLLKIIKFDYHFEPECGWMNDPNGLCYYKGQYHAFFQYNPFAPKWDTMHWGHAVSDDLITWKQVQTALYPDEEYENKFGCFSGSAIEKDGKLYLFYTAVSNRYGQAQAMATSVDAISFKKYEKNPIIPYSPYSKNRKNRDFRDPKVFEAFGKYYMVVGACKGKEGQVLLYSSRDLCNWEFKNVVYATEEFGGTLECPDMFALGDKWILLFSAMKTTVAASVFVIGDFDGETFIPDKVTYSEYGKDFYAPQTFETLDARRIMIGWFYHWGKPLPSANGKVAGALSIPRELSLVNGYVHNYPVKEARHLLKSECEYVKINGTTISIFGLDGNKVYEKDFYGVNGIKRIEKIDILFDKKTVEVFINGGVVSISQWLIFRCPLWKRLIRKLRNIKKAFFKKR